jgi:hypothetical protein
MKMKSYWKLLSLVFFVALVIGSFYIQGSLASSGKPDFVIKKRSGDEEVVKNLVMMGSLPVGNYLNDTVHIDDTETIYESEGSFIEGLDNIHLFPEMKRLQQDYRNFMRGKFKDPSVFYEDENHVAYANIKWDQSSIGPTRFSFDIAVLDKNSKEVTVIQESLPSYNHANVRDVQWIDGKLKVAAEIHPDMNGWKSEIHLYTFDLNRQQLIEDQLLSSVDDEKNPNSSVTVLTEEGNIGAKKELLIEETKWKSVPYRDGSRDEKVDSQLILYNYETDEQKSIEKPEFQFDLVSLYNSVIYFMKRTENGLEIHPYDIESSKFLKAQILPVEMPSKISEENGGGFPVVTIKNDRIYLASPYKDEQTKASVLVADVKTWRILYEGTIEQSNPNENGKAYSLHLYSLQVE